MTAASSIHRARIEWLISIMGEQAGYESLFKAAAERLHLDRRSVEGLPEGCPADIAESGFTNVRGVQLTFKEFGGELRHESART